MKKPLIAILALSALNLFGYTEGELYKSDFPEKSCMKFNREKKVPINYSDAKADIYKKLDILDKIGGGGRSSGSRESWCVLLQRLGCPARH